MKLNIKKLKAEMKRQGFTHKTLAAKLGKNRQSVTHYLNGNAGKSFRVIENLARALDLDPKDLVI